MQLLQPLDKRPVDLHLTFQGVDLSIPALDQSDKLANHARALCSEGRESLVLICEISAGSGVTGKLGVAGCSAPDVVLQACNAGSISSAPSLQAGHFLRVVMGVFLLGGTVLEHGNRLLFSSCLRLLGDLCSLLCLSNLNLAQPLGLHGQQ
ncbi:hypothetical protein P245_15460 [Comamonas thiooxydans]|uniref:Uncharacterized protein n=1 Tax=Comamonas thiooxydans TaxID=363952 RepID=A0A0E3BJF5_9BURK|nr:hypothetical protein P245_15460 [Comamonas thiooxydans]